jgi:hypothetical protein
VERVYTVEPKTGKLLRGKALSFSEAGIREREDLERWVSENPDLLGEELLVVTTEYDRFDKSNLRLDLLALDKTGKLVVVELKLDASRSLADLQALRYAAFCSTMTMDEMVTALADRRRVKEDEAAEFVREFLSKKELPDLDRKPRIILAAGSFDDQELTSTVLWLNACGVDITCVELTPHRLRDEDLILVPRVIIPLPEAKEYTVGILKKQQSEEKSSRELARFGSIIQTIVDEYGKSVPGFKVDTQTQTYADFWPAEGEVRYYYCWYVRRNPKQVDVALYLHSDRPSDDTKVQGVLAKAKSAITKGVQWAFDAESGGQGWRRVRFYKPYEADVPSQEIVTEAVSLMHVLVKRTRPIVDNTYKQIAGTTRARGS